MRKLIAICAAVFATFVASVSAPEIERRWSVDFGLGDPSIYFQYDFYWGLPLVERYSSESFLPSIKELDKSCYDLFVTPTLAVHTTYKIKDRWYAVSSIGYNHLWIDYFNPFTDEIVRKENTYAYDVLLGGRFIISYGLQFYVQALFGLAQQGKSDYWIRNAERRKLSDDIPSWIPYWLGFQIDLGFSRDIGDRWFLSGEFGFGTEHCSELGCRLGIGIKL